MLNYFLLALTPRAVFFGVVSLVALAVLVLAPPQRPRPALGLTSSFASAFLGPRFRPVPFAAARILALVSADGRLSVDAASVLDGWAFAAGLVLVVARTVVLTLALVVTLGNFTLRLVLGAVFVVFVVAVAVAAFDLAVAAVALFLYVRFVAGSVFFVAVDRETEARDFEIALLTPVLTVFRFLFSREADSSMTLPIFRFVVVLDCVFFALALSFFCSSLSLDRCSFSRGLGPNTPRQLAEPHRHCWTFFCE